MSHIHHTVQHHGISHQVPMLDPRIGLQCRLDLEEAVENIDGFSHTAGYEMPEQCDICIARVVITGHCTREI